MTVDPELIQAFLEESRENLDQLDLDLVALEGEPGDPELLGSVFRTIHTIKGTCGFLDYGRLEALSHAGEDLLAALRDGVLVLDEAITTSLLRMVDEIRDVLRIVENTGGEGDADHTQIIAELRGHLLHPQTAAAGVPPAPSPARPTGSAHEDSTVRIDVEVLDRLQDLVGELTLARLRMGDFVPDDGEFARAFHEFAVTTRDLQDSVMQARLQPVSTVTDRLRRVVRDLAAAQGKQVDLQITGGDVAVDKAINEVLRDPLVHLVRNAVDHGIETPTQRQAAGKPVVATVRIAAAVIGGGVQIEVSDDGRGVDGDRLVEKAVATGRLTAEACATMTASERLSLLFLPGVSTAPELTTVSGRGVGMDVVRTNLERVGGSVDVWSELGKGTTFRVNVPLTLAILPAIVVTCGQGRYTIPQADVQEIVRVAGAELDDRIRAVGSARFLRHRGDLLPLVDLADFLGVASARADDVLEVVVIHRQERMYGLIVDALADSVEAVVKALPRALRGESCYAGVTMLADGSPSLILEPAAPAAAADVHQREQRAAEPAAPVPSGHTDLLTVTVAADRLALPLACVKRLTTAAASELEHSGHDLVVQDHAEILRLIKVGDVLGLTSAASDELPIVVCNLPQGQVGLLVDSIVDIESADISSAEPVDDPCVAGRLVVGGRVTEVLDVDALARRGLHRHAEGSPDV